MENTKLAKMEIGQRYYTCNANNVLKVLRILKFRNENVITVYDESKGLDSRFLISKDKLEEEYTLLKTDIVYVFNIIQTTPRKKDKDIVIYGMRKQDASKSKPIPYIIARQMFISEQDENHISLGGCVINPEENIELFKYLSSSYKILDTTIIHSYIDDTLDVVNKLIPTGFKVQADKIMKSNMEEFIKSSRQKNYTGKVYVPRNIRTLMNNILYYIDTGLNIREDIDLYSSNPFERFEILNGYKLNNIDVISYHKDINLDLIKTPYILVRDMNTESKTKYKVFLVTYTPGENIKASKEDPLVSDIYEAFDRIKIKK